MAVVMTRTEQQSSLRSEISVASSGFALVTGSKYNRKPIPPFDPATQDSPPEPTPDYDDDSVIGDDSIAPNGNVFISEKLSYVQSNVCSAPSNCVRGMNISVSNGGHGHTQGHVPGFATEKFNKPEVHNINHCLQPRTPNGRNDSEDGSSRPLLSSVSSAGEPNAVSKKTLLKINPNNQEITVEMSQLSPNSSTNDSGFHLLQQRNDCLNDRMPCKRKRCSKCTQREKILCCSVVSLLLLVMILAVLLGLSGTCAVEIFPACRK